MSTTKSSSSSSWDSVALEHSECNICRELTCEPKQLFDEAEPPVKTKCGHFFGAKCLARWLMTRNTCPYCRAELVPSIGRYDEVFDHELFGAIIYSGRALRDHSFETQMTVLRLVMIMCRSSAWGSGAYEKRPCTPVELLELFWKGLKESSKTSLYLDEDLDIIVFLECALMGEEPDEFEKRMKVFEEEWRLDDDESFYAHLAHGAAQGGTHPDEILRELEDGAILESEDFSDSLSEDDSALANAIIAAYRSGLSSNSEDESSANGEGSSGRLEGASVSDETAQEAEESPADTNPLYYHRNAVAPRPAVDLLGRSQLPSYHLARMMDFTRPW